MFKVDEHPLDFTPQYKSTSPGRINLIGEHVDYNGGLAIPAAINRYTTVYAATRADQKLVIRSEHFPQTFKVLLAELYGPLAFREDWHRYVAGSVQLFHQACGLRHGIDLAIFSNVPLGKGISSSASLTLGILNVLNQMHGEVFNGTQLALMAQQVEHRYLDLSSGLLDQFAVQFSGASHLNMIDFQNLQLRPVYLHPNFREKAKWVLVDPGAKRSLAASGYQQRVTECRLGLQNLQAKFPEVDHYRDIKLQHLGSTLEDQRLRYFVLENQRVQKAMDCLESGDLQGMGALMNQTHREMDQLYEASLPSLNHLQQIGTSHVGCFGGRLMGGGFGGCILFLIDANRISTFIDYLHSNIHGTFDTLILELSQGVNSEAI